LLIKSDSITSEPFYHVYVYDPETKTIEQEDTYLRKGYLRNHNTRYGFNINKITEGLKPIKTVEAQLPPRAVKLLQDKFRGNDLKFLDFHITQDGNYIILINVYKVTYMAYKYIPISRQIKFKYYLSENDLKTKNFNFKKYYKISEGLKPLKSLEAQVPGLDMKELKEYFNETYADLPDLTLLDFCKNNRFRDCYDLYLETNEYFYVVRYRQGMLEKFRIETSDKKSNLQFIADEYGRCFKRVFKDNNLHEGLKPKKLTSVPFDNIPGFTEAWERYKKRNNFTQEFKIVDYFMARSSNTYYILIKFKDINLYNIITLSNLNDITFNRSENQDIEWAKDTWPENRVESERFKTNI
jgi:hypothetical protein